MNGYGIERPVRQYTHQASSADLNTSHSLIDNLIRHLGVTVTVVNQCVTELVPNFGTTEGQKTQQIMGEEIISKL